MTVFEAVGRGSIPRRGTFHLFSECAGFARDSAKVEDQVRFLARTIKFRRRPIREDEGRNAIVTNQALEPDGKAIGCNPIEVGSTPTGVSLNGRSLMLSVQRHAGHQTTASRRCPVWHCLFREWDLTREHRRWLAQWQSTRLWIWKLRVRLPYQHPRAG